MLELEQQYRVLVFTTKVRRRIRIEWQYCEMSLETCYNVGHYVLWRTYYEAEI